MSFDTHAAVKMLTAAGADEDLAVAVVAVAQNAATDQADEQVTTAVLDARLAGLRSELAALEVRLLKWMIGTAVAVASVAVAVLRLLD